jgi:acetoin utilization protein AcuB
MIKKGAEMRVRDFMKKEVITVKPKTPIMDALDIMKKSNIRHLPVIRDGKFAGFVTRGMLRDASPSHATSLSIYELNYLISKMTVEKIMIKDPITISPDLPVEEAIWLGQKHDIAGFPVVEDNNLVGIITQSDVSGVVAGALGVGDSGSKRITIDASGKRFGYLKNLVQLLDSHKIPMMSLMGIERSQKGDWYMILRLKTEDASAAVEDLKANGFKVTDVT